VFKLTNSRGKLNKKAAMRPHTFNGTVFYFINFILSADNNTNNTRRTTTSFARQSIIMYTINNNTVKQVSKT